MKDINVKFYKFDELSEGMQKFLVNEYISSGEFRNDYEYEYEQFYSGKYHLSEDKCIQKMYQFLVSLSRHNNTGKMSKDDVLKFLDEIINSIDWDCMHMSFSLKALEAYKYRVSNYLNKHIIRVCAQSKLEEYNFKKLFDEYDNPEYLDFATVVQDFIDEVWLTTTSTLLDIEERENDFEVQKEWYLSSFTIENEMFTKTGIKYSDIFGE